MVEQEYTKVRSLGHLEEIAELEGAQDFSYSTLPRRKGGWGPNSPSAIYELEAERDIGEADIVKLVGDTLYILNAFRGLEIVDLCDPDDPKVVGHAPVMGFPDDMYIVDDRAYIIVTSTRGFYTWRSDLPTFWNHPLLQYRIGSRLLILDISSPSDPWIIREIPIEGFVSDSRRVGDVLYYVSNCRSWYNQYTGARMEAMTYVMSVNIANPWDIYMKDAETFLGRSFVTHVTTDHMYIAHWEQVEGLSYGMTNITLLDISDPRGKIEVRDEFSVEGRVNDRYQMDEYEDTFRVVSHYSGRPRESELWTFDIADPREVRSLGRLLIDDAGRLMATRFEGDRAYTIHYPGSTRMMAVPMPDVGGPDFVAVPDPLEVIDLSDPAEPVLCDIFEMPGWVTHMEVRGKKILAIGVDDSEDEWNVAVSLFDVSDPWQAEMLDRVRLGGNISASTANWDPKALTVLDDQGIALVPYSTRY
ncbi:MAG: beta-propeller domain-containing protein, partial [Thermoplasmata archaeon]|nr:beta-propeller domain-containing protein [Thermoplasmata archaeon]